MAELMWRKYRCTVFAPFIHAAKANVVLQPKIRLVPFGRLLQQMLLVWVDVRPGFLAAREQLTALNTSVSKRRLQYLECWFDVLDVFGPIVSA
jgi:hypothetical protein